MPRPRRTTSALAALALLTACGTTRPEAATPTPTIRPAPPQTTPVETTPVVTRADAEVARRFARFAADPSRSAPFVDGDVWLGIEDGLVATRVGPADRADRRAWETAAGYAEVSGPLSPLDLVTGDGGRYDLHPGILPTCPVGSDDPPPELADHRAITLAAPADVVDSCLQAWAVTLFLDDADRIAGVALRLGTP